MEDKRPPFQLNPIHLLIFLGLFTSVVLLLLAYLNYQEAKKILHTSLFLQAKGYASVIKSLLKSFPLRDLQEKRSFLSDLIFNEEWEGVAYLALYREDGSILLHTNQGLIGFREKSFSPKKILSQGGFINLGKEEGIFIYDTEVKLSEEVAYLRVALYVIPVEERLKFAKAHFLFEIGASFFLLTLTFLFYLYLRRMTALEMKLKALQTIAFLSQSLAHEIKNPLASIKGFAQYLMTKEVKEEQRKILNIIHQEAMRIEKLLRDLVIFAHPAKPEISTFDLKEIISEVLLLIKATSPPEVEFVVDLPSGPILIHSDRDKLKQIFFNLLDNAVKALEGSTTKRVYLSLKAEAQEILLSIKDTGIGIPPENLSRIWEPFFSTRAKGLGLGLPIVKKLAQELNLKITIQSKLGEGTEVWLHLPLKSAS